MNRNATMHYENKKKMSIAPLRLGFLVYGINDWDTRTKPIRHQALVKIMKENTNRKPQNHVILLFC